MIDGSCFMKIISFYIFLIMIIDKLLHSTITTYNILLIYKIVLPHAILLYPNNYLFVLHFFSVEIYNSIREKNKLLNNIKKVNKIL